MTELESYIAAYPPAQLAIDLQADPAWAAFNILWKSPYHIAPACNWFGLTTVDQAHAFAAALLDGSGWVAHRDKLSRWINPRPGVPLEQMVAKPWAEVEAVMAGPLIPKAAQYWVKPTDGTVYVPTQAQFGVIMANCPAKRIPWAPERNDCDDRAFQLKGWNSEHGIGQCAIAFAGYEAYMGNALQGTHALGLGICIEPDGSLKPYLGEPADGRVYPITKANLGGYSFATRIAMSLDVF